MSVDPKPVDEPRHRWRLVLGSEAEASCGALQGDAAAMDRALAALYEPDGPQGLNAPRSAGRGGSAPSVARWLGDIRQYFPASVVQVMQREALQRLKLREMLTQPEMLEAVPPDLHLVASLVSLSQVIPAGTRETARRAVRKVVDELMKKLLIDQSGSMAARVVYSSIFGAVLASLAAAIRRDDVAAWAAGRGLVTSRASA